MKMIRIAVVAILAMIIAACGGGGGGGGGAVQQSVPVPAISGIPWDSIVVGDEYRFVPDVTNASTFSITNKPGWASFDATTGSLTGTPSNGDAGTYEQIVISASNGSGTVSLPPFSITVLITAKSATVTLATSASLSAPLGGLGVTYLLPPGVTPAISSDGNVAPGAIVVSGVTAGRATIPAEAIKYVAPSVTTAGYLQFLLVDAAEGFGAGEFVTINLEVAEWAHPKRSAFLISGLSAWDTYGYGVRVSAGQSISFR